MKATDHWLGLPLCFLLGVLAAAARCILPSRRRPVSGRRPIAVLKFFGLGSIVEATPLLRALRKRYPDAPLVFVSFGPSRELLQLTGLCTHVRLIRTDSPLRFAADAIATLWWLRRCRVEAVIDLELFSKFSTLVSFASGASTRVGYHLNNFWRYSLVTHPVYYNYFGRLPDVFAEAGAALGAPVADRGLQALQLPPAARDAVAAWLQAQGWRPGTRLVGVNVNAAELSFERRWPLDRFAAVVEAILGQDPQLRVVLTGSPDEREYVQSLLPLLSETARTRVAVAAGQWSLAEFLAGLEMMDAFVTNDSGPLHLAAAQGVPIVSIWGPTRPEFFAPAAADQCIVSAHHPCSPCVGMFTTFEGMSCRGQAHCMQAIETAAVLTPLRSLLHRPCRTTGGAS